MEKLSENNRQQEEKLSSYEVNPQDLALNKQLLMMLQLLVLDQKQPTPNPQKRPLQSQEDLK